MNRNKVNLVEVCDVSLSQGNKLIFKDIHITVPRGKITAIMGPSGIGKTTLLRMICGQIQPDSGKIFFDGENILKMSRSQLFTVRKRMSILFQSGALLTDMNVFDNVAYPLREHTALPTPILKSIVIMKLEAVGLRGAAKLKPSELSGGMTRRVAMARAIALEPDLIMFDEPFVGQDSITMGILIKLLSDINNILGITCIVVSHNVHEVLSIADHTYILADKKVVANGSSDVLKNNIDPRVRQFLNGIADGPLPFRYPAGNYHDDLLGIERPKQLSMLNAITSFGDRSIKTIRTFGRASFMLFNALVGKPEFRKHAPLLLGQIYNIGILSMSIIIISGLFIGMVLGLQGYFMLNTYSAENTLGVLVSFSLLRELGPVFSALLFAGCAGSALTAEIGLMRTTEQLSSIEMMAIDPLRRIISPRFWAGVISLPMLTMIFIAAGIWSSSLVGIQWKGIDAGLFWSAMKGSMNLKIDFLNCMIKSLIFALTITWISLFYGYDTNPTSEGISRATTRTVMHSSLIILGLDFLLTLLMFWN